MPGVIGMLVNRIKSGLTAKVFKLFVASIIAVGMLFGIMPAYAAFAQNIQVGGTTNQATSLNANGAADAEKTKKQKDTENPNDLFANNPKLKQALYNSIKEYDTDDVTLPDSVNNWNPKKADMEKIKKLGLSIEDISDISFLKYFPNLEELKLDHNNISDLKPLSTLTNLKTLDLSDNNISDISKLAGLTNLESLDISENKISNVDNLANLCAGKLINIKAEKNNITNIDKIYPYALAKNTAFYADYHKDIFNLYQKKYDSLYDFSDQHIEKNITPSDAKNGYNLNQIVNSTKIKDDDYSFTYWYAYMNNFDLYRRKYTLTNELINIDKNDGVKLIDFKLNKKLGKDGYNGMSPVHYGPDFRFSGRLLIRQYVINNINIEVNFGQSIDFRNALEKLKNSEVKGYRGKISDLGLEFSSYDPWGVGVNSNSPDDQTAFFPGKQTFEFPVCYKNGEIKNNIEGYYPVDNFTFIVNAKTMAQTWPAKSSDVKIKDIDSSSENPPAKQPTVDSIKTDVKKQVEGLFTTTSRLNYPLIPEGKTPTACDLCDHDTEDCSSACQNDDDNPDDGFSSDSRPYYYNDDNDKVYPIKIGDSYYKSCNDEEDSSTPCTPKYYYKAPTVTVDDFKIPDATSEDQTVNVPVTVTYVDGSQCKFSASFTVKAKSNPNTDPPNPPAPNPPAPEPTPDPQPQPQPQPQPSDPQDPSVTPVTPTPAPTPDQPGSPSGQSHMTEPDILPKPYLNIDITPDPNIGTTPNTGSANINTTNTHLNQKPDASRNGASKDGVAFAKSANRHKTAAGINSASHKSRGTIPATGSDSSLIALAAILSVLLGVVAIRIRKNPSRKAWVLFVPPQGFEPWTR
ncbi:leucine-rich repeat domain-containing protein [Gardnerella vaginalis]|uniref:LPXTG-motif protein cell wall anchor domain protein n=1 Tax=Gardnerella vaginalis TaxID=2702 RepID=A0A133NM12_GARVA|nr:leucine-rich repeat domain-containing protein [Gardnerella vaginalis]KXA17324.1 LPXTG-motif protein cell wall anchor domain protein [Gardnerella vaginalis]